jgi:UTP:GlnB (protein PII) uridylyltransferase
MKKRSENLFDFNFQNELQNNLNFKNKHQMTEKIFQNYKNERTIGSTNALECIYTLKFNESGTKLATSNSKKNLNF